MSEKMTILFVDDEPNILTGLKRALHRSREVWTLLFAESGAEALEILSKEPVDLMVTDMKMPHMSGLELLKIVAEKYPRVVRFILSGQSDSDTIIESVSYAHQYLAKPFDLGVLTSTVQRVQHLRSPLRNNKLLDYVTGMENLPSLPEVYIKVNAEMHSEDVSPRKVGQIIEQDPSLAASILKYVNSSFFGLGTRIKDAHQACVYLGMDTIRSLVLSEKLFGKAPATDEATLNELAALKKHSLQVSILTRFLASYFKLPFEEMSTASTAGVMHDIGKLIILTKADDHRAIGELLDKSLPELDAELQIMGTTHADLGAYLLGIWGVPNALTDLVAFHHHPSLANGDKIDLLTCLHIANAFVNASEPIPQAIKCPQYDMAYLDQLGLSDQLDEIHQLLEEQIKDTGNEG